MRKWKCPICAHLNSEDSELCEGCGSLRQDATYDIESDLEDDE